MPPRPRPPGPRPAPRGGGGGGGRRHHHHHHGGGLPVFWGPGPWWDSSPPVVYIDNAIDRDCVAYDEYGQPRAVPCRVPTAALRSTVPLGHTAYHHVGDAGETAGVWFGRAAVGAAVFHGYRRNKSVGWAIGWAVAAMFAPVITTGVAVAQGFGKPKGH